MLLALNAYTFEQYKFNIALSMRNSRRLFLSLVTALALLSIGTGCASITGTTNQNLSIQTREPSGAEVTGATCEIINSKGKWFITTPGTTSINRSNDDLQVICRKEGYDVGRNGITSATKGMMFGNIIFGGGIGAVIDHSSGAAYEYPSFFQIIMTRSRENTRTSSAVNNTNLESKLKELKRLYEENLITKEAYEEQQRRLMNSQ